MRSYLKNGICRGVDDPLAGSYVLGAVIAYDLRSGIRLIDDYSPSSLFGKGVDYFF